MNDIEERASHSGAAARRAARRRLQQLEAPVLVPTRPGRGRVLAAAGALAAVGLVALVVVLDVVPVLSVDPVGPTPGELREPVARDGVLPLPPVGASVAAYLEDGSPVFVGQPEPGELVVVDAVSQRGAGGWAGLVLFCRTSGWYEEPRFTSMFNGWGEVTDGPAPAGLARYPTEPTTDGDGVRVVGPPSAPPDRRAGAGRGHAPVGRPCSDPVTDEGVGHRPPTDVPAVDGRDLPDRWTWVVLVVGGDADDPRACDADGTCPPDAPPVIGVAAGDPGVLLDRTPRTVLAKTDEGLVRVVHPAVGPDGMTITSSSPGADQPLLRLPEAGDALAVHLADGTPVFVIRTTRDEVHVLDPTAPGSPLDLVGWCRDEGRFVSREGARFESDGSLAGDPEGQGLGALPHEVVTVGETRGVEVTGPPRREGSTRAPATGRAAPPGCQQGPLSGHAPGPHTPVVEPGSLVDATTWTWVRMPIRTVEGRLHLCASGDERCGLPGDPVVDTVCYPGGPGRAEDCWTVRDPVVTTPGPQATDGDTLLLVRSPDNGRTVEVRRPVDG